MLSTNHTPLVPQTSDTRVAARTAMLQAVSVDDHRIRLATLHHQRAMWMAQVSRNKESYQAELDAYKALLTLLTGEQFDAQAAQDRMYDQAKAKYAKLGFDIESPEFAAAVEHTIEAIQGQPRGSTVQSAVRDAEQP